MKHFMTLNKTPFLLIKSGAKRVEMRLNDEKRQKIKVGDYIEFVQVDTEDKITCLVTKITQHKDFYALYRCYDKLELGYLAHEVADASHMLQYYLPQMIEKYGVVAITLKID